MPVPPQSGQEIRGGRDPQWPTATMRLPQHVSQGYASRISRRTSRRRCPSSDESRPSERRSAISVRRLSSWARRLASSGLGVALTELSGTIVITGIPSIRFRSCPGCLRSAGLSLILDPPWSENYCRCVLVPTHIIQKTTTQTGVEDGDMAGRLSTKQADKEPGIPGLVTV